MRRILLVAVIGLIALSVLAVVYIWDHQAMEKATQGEGNGRFYQMKRDNVAIAANFNQLYGGPEHLDHRASGQATGVPGSPWKDRLGKVIEDCVRATKNLPTSVSHRLRPHLAPPGVYFTLPYLSVPSPVGVTGLAAGTRVVCAKDEGAALLVKMGNLEFEVKRQYLTNDLDVADLALRNDVEAQQAVKSVIAEQQTIDQARRDEENAAFDQRQREIAAERAARAAQEVAAYSNPLDRGAYNETYGVSGPPSVGQITLLPQLSRTTGVNLVAPVPKPTP
jgi:hypothetical protein